MNPPSARFPAVAANYGDCGILSLKMERIWRLDFADNYQEATHDVKDYIVSFHNRKRLHSTWGYRSSTGYEREMAA
jgi:transposase InsO family protein